MNEVVCSLCLDFFAASDEFLSPACSTFAKK